VPSFSEGGPWKLQMDVHGQQWVGVCCEALLGVTMVIVVQHLNVIWDCWTGGVHVQLYVTI
jgi:hypothetical protein